MMKFQKLFVFFFSVGMLLINEAYAAQLPDLTVKASRYKGKSAEVVKLFDNLKPYPERKFIKVDWTFSGLTIVRGLQDSWDELTPDAKVFLQDLIDEVVSNNLHVSAGGSIWIEKQNGRSVRSETRENWHKDAGGKERIRKTLITFSNSDQDLATRISSAQVSGSRLYEGQVHPRLDEKEIQLLESTIVPGLVAEGDFVSGDFSLFYHRAPTEHEVNSSERILISFYGGFGDDWTVLGLDSILRELAFSDDYFYHRSFLLAVGVYLYYKTLFGYHRD